MDASRKRYSWQGTRPGGATGIPARNQDPRKKDFGVPLLAMRDRDDWLAAWLVSLERLQRVGAGASGEVLTVFFMFFSLGHRRRSSVDGRASRTRNGQIGRYLSANNAAHFRLHGVLSSLLFRRHRTEEVVHERNVHLPRACVRA